MSIQRISKVLAVVCLGLIGQTAHARIVSYEFGVLIGIIIVDDEGGFEDCGPNCRVRGRVRFDSRADGVPNPNEPAGFVYDSAVRRMNARFWDGTRLAERLSPGNSHFSTFDQLLPNSYYGIVVGDAVNDSFGFYIEGEGAIGNPLTLAELLLVEDWLSLRTELTAAHFELEGRGTASGHITYFRRVPEPAAFVLIWLSLAAIGLGRRRPAA